MNDISKKNNSKDKKIKSIEKILKDFLIDSKRKEADEVLNMLDGFSSKINPFMIDSMREHKKININIFFIKIALLGFNGALLALMVGNVELISFGNTVFILLFVSFAVGIIQLIHFYLSHVIDHIKTNNLVDKVRAMYDHCKRNKDDINAIEDTKTSIRNIIYKHSKSKNHNNIQELIEYFDKNQSVSKEIIKNILVELLFYIPLLSGFSIVIIKILLYI